MEITEFLQARIAEDETAARRSMPGPWTVVPDRGRTGTSHSIWSSGGGYPITQTVINGPTTEHIARWDSTHVLEECGVKRRIVALHHLIDGVDSWGKPVRGCFNCCGCGTEGEYLIAGPCMTLRLLALPHVDHPDYDEAWRV